MCHAQTRAANPTPITTQPPTVSTPHEQQIAATSTKLARKHATNRDRRLKGFHGIHSESASREGGLLRAQEEETSTYSLSKYHFPAPPGDYRVGLSGTSFSRDSEPAGLRLPLVKAICNIRRQSITEVCDCKIPLRLRVIS